MESFVSLESLTTELVNPDLLNMDTLSVKAILELMSEEDEKVIPAVRSQISSITRAVNRVVASFKAGGRLIYIGAGTSGRLGVLDASECPPTFGVPAEMVVGIIAGGDSAIRKSVERAEDNMEAGALAMTERSVSDKDTVIGISASGRAPFVRGALVRAAQYGASTVALVNNRPSELEKVAAITIAPVTGPEVLAGSTRLKAATAQKMVLNMISTTAMIETGKTYGNMMVDVQATNAKLVARAKRIVRQVTGASSEEAKKALDEAGGSAKVAILMLTRKCGANAARELLESSNGFLRKALGGL
jgi:N-acetylmuramic acid 6-phosphate etherase